jgi:hypothetical protein
MNGFRPPVYGPGQSEALMEDPMSLMLMMTGMPVLQQAMGQNNFIPHFTPSQALNDQFIASKYQRDQFNSLNAAAELGNKAVADRLLGLRSLITDAPASQLNKEQASMFASVINNPISKAMIASQIGPDTMEALFFGRKGDPSALAATSNRISFFRKDTLGDGKRMSGESMEDFATNVYQNLYGTGADVDAMHGFMAGQTGELMENLFQRGQLPQSLGELNPADRVRAISSAQRDDATMTKLAEQFGHKEMMKDAAYSGATIEERKKMLATRAPEFKGKLEQTFTEIDRFKASDPRAKSAGEIEKMSGYGTAARNVDAQRVSKVAKDYTGAVDAVREIFGDNGAGDAPMGQLIAALDALSAGSIDRVDPKKVEKTVREMRVLARGTGMNLEALAQLGLQGEALAQVYGTPQHLQSQANLQTMQTAAGMRNAGMFDRKIYGDMTQAEATREAQHRVYRGQASEAGKSMAAMNRMYQENLELYRGTELEAAMKAYNDPNSGGEYEFGGQKKNLAAMMARNGRGAATGLVQASGGNAEVFQAFYYDRGTQEYQQSGLELITQRQEMTKHLAVHTLKGQLETRMSGQKYAALRRRGQTDDDFERERDETAGALSHGFADLIMNEAANLPQNQRGAHIEKRHKEMMQEYFVYQGMSKKDAVKRADQMSSAMFGDTEARRRETFSAISATSNTYAVQRTNQQLSANEQIYSQKVEQGTRAVAVSAAEEAQKNKELEKGRESSLLQRSGEVLERMGQDPAYSGTQAAKDILGVVPIDEKTGELMTPAQAAAQPTRLLMGMVDEERKKDPNATTAQIVDRVDARQQAAAAQDQLRTVGGASAREVAQETAFHRADQGLSSATINPDSLAPAAMVGVSAAAVYGNSGAGMAAVAQEASSADSTGRLVFKGAQGAVDATNTATTAAAKYAPGSRLVQRASPALRALGRVAPFLSPVLGGIAGGFEGASNGRGTVEGAIMGALTGDASTGSMFSGALGIEKGSTADKSLGVLGATATGAMTGAAIGSIIPVVGTAVGAGIGGALGFGTEMYKWATEPTNNVTQSQAVDAVQRTVNTEQNSSYTQQAAQGGGKSEITVNGTLAIRGMQEAVLQATGERPMDTPGGGAPVFASSGV